MDALTLIGCYGAALATLLAIFEFYKNATSGARIHVHVSTNMQFNQPITQGEDAKGPWIILTAVNVGDRPTTITHFLGQEFKSRLHRYFRKPVHSYWGKSIPELSPKLPYVLRPGHEWCGFLNETHTRGTMEDGSILYVGVKHNCCKRPVSAPPRFPRRSSSARSTG